MDAVRHGDVAGADAAGTNAALRVTSGKRDFRSCPGSWPDEDCGMLPRSVGFRIVLAWFAVAAFYSAQNVLVGAARHRPLAWQWDIFHEFVYWLTWAAFTPLVLAAARRRPLAPRAGIIVPHLGVMVALAPAQIVTTYTVHYLILSAIGQPPAPGLGAWLGGLGAGILWGTLTGFLYYWVILGIHAAFLYQQMYQTQLRAAAELEGRLAAAQLDALRLQLHPHFLFNTLNAISAFVGAEPEQARRMLARLGDLLRGTLDRDAAEISLTQELGLLAPYLDIQRIRFGDRLHLELDVAPDAGAGLVPTLILQPLVENAVEHGVSRRPGEATIRVRATRHAERLLLEIADDGPGPSGGGNGIGLRNTRERLLRLYGAAHRMELGSGPRGGTVVVVEIPYRERA